MLDQLRRDITTRLNELVGEADKLRRALIALSPRPRDNTKPPAPTTTRTRSSTPTPRPASRPAKAAAPAAARATPGSTKTAVLAALAGGKAMTASEVAAKTHLGTATVSTTLSRLAKTGEITKADRGYQAKPQT